MVHMLICSLAERSETSRFCFYIWLFVFSVFAVCSSMCLFCLFAFTFLSCSALSCHCRISSIMLLVADSSLLTDDLFLYDHCSCFCSADDTGDEFAASGSGWDSLSIRHAFIRKVHTHTCCTHRADSAPVCVCHVFPIQ